MTFSERYGYTKVSDVIIRERMTPEIQNAICNCYVEVKRKTSNGFYRILEFHIQKYYLNASIEDIPKLSFLEEVPFNKNPYIHYVIIPFLQNEEKEWYKKIDIIEKTIEYLNDNNKTNIAEEFASDLNEEFERLNFGYRIIDNLIVDIVSDLEIKTIEKAINENTDNVSMHLNEALSLYSQLPNPDYRNSIKEAISAVEAVNRNITDESTLNLRKMEGKGLSIPSVLTKSFNILYGYANAPTTGIRHALMDENSEYIPKAEEALYMIITCSAFINYLNGKMK